MLCFFSPHERTALRSADRQDAHARNSPTIPAKFLNLQAYNRYSYVYNNPLNYVDPGGLTPENTTASSAGITPESVNEANKQHAQNSGTNDGAIEAGNLEERRSWLSQRSGGGAPPPNPKSMHMET